MAGRSYGKPYYQSAAYSVDLAENDRRRRALEIQHLKDLASRRPAPPRPVRLAAVPVEAAPVLELNSVLDNMGSLTDDMLTSAYHLAGEQKANDIRLAVLTELMKRGVMG